MHGSCLATRYELIILSAYKICAVFELGPHTIHNYVVDLLLIRFDDKRNAKQGVYFISTNILYWYK